VTSGDADRCTDRRAVGEECLFTEEENPRLCGWGAELSSIVSEEILARLEGILKSEDWESRF
jgi:hypothetical protein